MRRFLLAVSVGALGVAVPALAARSCPDEIQAVCPNLDGDALARCLDAHPNTLSKPCTEQVQQAAHLLQSASPGLRACMDDLQKLCPGAENSTAGFTDCVVQKMDALSEACKSWMQTQSNQ